MSEQDHIALPERRADRPVTLAHRLEYGAMRSLFFLFRLIGLDASSALAGKFCRFAGPMIGAVSKRGRDNLQAAYPDWSDRQVSETLRGVWENLGRTAAEFAHLEKFDPFNGDRIRINGAEKLKAIAASGAPVIFVSGHFANWEIMSIAFHRAGIDYGVVYRAANNPLVDELIIKARARVMSRRQIPKGPRGARALVDTLKSGRSLAMLVDQKLNDGIAADFMGRPAMTAPTPARLSLKFNAPLIPVSITREKNTRFTITIHDPIAYRPCGDITADTLALTQRVNDTLERHINAHPAQWLWLHRRWPKKG